MKIRKVNENSDPFNTDNDNDDNNKLVSRLL